MPAQITISDVEAGMTFPPDFTVHGTYSFGFGAPSIECSVEVRGAGTTPGTVTPTTLGGSGDWQADFTGVPPTQEEGDATITAVLKDGNGTIVAFVVVGYLTISANAPIVIDRVTPLQTAATTTTVDVSVDGGCEIQVGTVRRVLVRSVVNGRVIGRAQVTPGFLGSWSVPRLAVPNTGAYTIVAILQRRRPSDGGFRSIASTSSRQRSVTKRSAKKTASKQLSKASR